MDTINLILFKFGRRHLVHELQVLSTLNAACNPAIQELVTTNSVVTNYKQVCFPEPNQSSQFPLGSTYKSKLLLV
ncbi:hypothetical protein AC249_AIPGENE10976 [Exaiptasia diaphana]|nr:hypothetical protein AC249_AIPGENE10976 [Exaiptasia diaphana]